MKKPLFILVALLLAFCTIDASGECSSVRFRGDEREYYLFMPDTLAEGRPFVIYLHGYGGRAEGSRPNLREAALKNGFAICYPQGLKDPKGKPSWNVGYPKQKGMKTDDVAFILFLVRHLAAEHGLNSSNAFLTGSSNGGEMCYIMALSHPSKFRAIASLAGLQMGWTVEKIKPKGNVPFMEVHGTEDVTSRWEGDPVDRYGWGQYLAVPSAVSNIVSMNRCIHYTKTVLPPYKEDRTAILHHYDLGTDGAEVLFYEVVGGTHRSVCGDMDTYGEMFKFFTRHLKR